MRLVRRRSIAGTLAVGAIALIAGCGGGGDSSAASADDYRQAADQICADANQQTSAISTPTSAAEFLPALQEQLPIEQTQLDKFEALVPPADLKAAHDKAVAFLQKRDEIFQQAVTRISGGESPTAVLQDLTSEIDQANAQGKEAAKELGLKVCGTGGAGTDTSTEAATTTAPAGTTTAPSGTTTAPTATGTPSQYVNDVQAATDELKSFATLLQSSTGLADLKSKVPQAKEDLDKFDAAIATLATYTLADADLEQTRAGLVRTGPKVSDVLNRFLDAIQKEDIAAVQKLVPELTATVAEFQAAATGGTTTSP
jgi:hypothetical protein